MKHIHTIGYEAADLSDFVRTLLASDVDVLVDLRAVAVSRRKGFSKTALAKCVQDAGIGYQHFRSLGDPKPGRDAAREGRFADFRRLYGAHLKTPGAQAALKELSELVGKQRVALLCYEADATNCHRAIVGAEIAKQRKMTIVHLQVERGNLGVQSRARARHCAGEGLAAA